MTRYSRGAIVLHWAIGLLVLVNFVSGFTGIGFANHKAIGITVLVLTIVWIGVSLTRRAPPLPVGVPRWQRGASKVAHAMLYAFCLAMPLLGWLMVSNTMALRPLDWFGLFDIPYLTISPAAGDVGRSGHELLALPFALLIAIHFAAALKHQFVDRDGLLGRMLPAPPR